MDPSLTIPPKSKNDLTSPKELAKTLSRLIGEGFKLSGKTRTDGSNARKAVARLLVMRGLPTASNQGDYSIVPPRGKGVPRILREFVDTYIVTTGTSYNLQVWNRNPAANSIQVQYSSGGHLSAHDVRFVFLRIDPIQQVVDSVIVLSPEYIEEKFGKFGKPTIKHQIIISSKVRESILSTKPPIVFETDTKIAKQHLAKSAHTPSCSFREAARTGEILSLEYLKKHVAEKLIGTILTPAATKTRGQDLEKKVGTLLGYNMEESQGLVGGYPDIRSQVLEVKVQDSPTVDLGKYSPQFQETVPDSLNLSTTDVRYLIALTEAETGVVQGVILCPGASLGNYFAYVVLSPKE